tara:strand:+ start:7498 stop:7740 length:243 start_codon:yes stop_codon:yes gene_type:complete
MLLAVFVTLSATPSQAATDDGKEFCWKDSYGRGVGTVPQKCKSGYDRIGLLCYKKCGKKRQEHEAFRLRLSFGLPVGHAQ